MKKRSTSFGYGSKFDFFQKKQYTPSPSQYHVDENEGRTNASSFGYGRNVK